MNTCFQKRDEHLLTYKHVKSHPGGPPYVRPLYETLGYILVPNRWQNAVRDISADPSPGVNTDHYPLRMELQIRLKARHKPERVNEVFLKCNEEEAETYNHMLKRDQKRETRL